MHIYIHVPAYTCMTDSRSCICVSSKMKIAAVCLIAALALLVSKSAAQYDNGSSESEQCIYVLYKSTI